jgi:hypothetical protein
MIEMEMKILNIWQRKILTRIYGPVVERLWRIRINLELRKPYRDLDTVADTKKTRLEWI